MPGPSEVNAVWTEERIARLKELFEQGLSYSEMGNELGITRNAAMGKAKRLGLERPHRLQGSQPAGLATVRTSQAGNYGGDSFAPIKRIKSRREAHGDDMASLYNIRGAAKRSANGIEDVRPVVPIVPVVPLNLTLMQLTDTTCKFECSGSDSPAEYLFCGHRVVEGKPYCKDHCSVAYVPIPKRDRSKDAIELGRHRGGVFGRAA